MGAPAGYCRPVEATGLSTWTAHTNRGTPSTEPGTDFYTPTGTPVRAASSGVVVDVGGSIYAATGRYVTIDLDDGRRVRYLHLLRSHVRVGQRVQWGEVVADSGASGYGSDLFGESSRNDAFWANTGGDHVHMTLWAGHYYQFGRYSTLDPELYMEDDMPTIGEIFNTPITKGPDGNDITLANFMGYAHLWNAQATWAHPLKHALADKNVSAGDLLRYEPAEHEGTRRAVAQVGQAVTPDIDYARVVAELKAAGLDPQKFAVYAADEADRRERERLAE